MADKPFLQSLFDAPADDAGSLFKLPQVKQDEPQAAPEPDTRRPVKADRWLPPTEYRPIFDAAAREFDVPVNVVMALAHQESRYNPQAIGTDTKWGRARGMMQYLDGTAKGLGINPFDPAEAIPAAARQIRERLDKGYSMEDAVKEHFAGPDRKQWGSKTAAYGREVMEKVGKIGEFMDVPSQEAEAKPSSTDGLIRLTPDQEARIQAGEDPDQVLGLNPSSEPVWSTEPKPRTTTEEYVTDPLQRGYLNMKRGFTANAAMFNAKELGTIAKIDRGEQVPEMEDTAGYQYMNPAQRSEYKKQLATSFESGAKRTAELGKEVEAIPQDPIVAKASSAKSFDEWWTYFKQAPFKFIANTGVESLPNMAPGLVAGGIAGAGARSLIAGAAGMGAGSYAVDYPSTVLSALEEAGIKTSDPEQLAAAFANEKLMEDVRKQAHAHALVVGALDGVSGGRAGATIVPGKGLLRKGANLAAKTVEQGALGAGGEAGGQIAQGKKELEFGPIMSEFAGEMAGAPAEIAGAAKAKALEMRAKAKEQPAEQPVAQPTPADAAPVTTTPQAPAAVPTATPPQSTVTVTPPATSQASGPLGRAQENAAEQHAAQPPRATVATPEGTITGFIDAYQEDGQGNFVARILADDGQVYQFTQADGVQVAIEQPQAAGPMTAAVEKAAEEHAATPAIEPQAGTQTVENPDAVTPISEQSQAVTGQSPPDEGGGQAAAQEQAPVAEAPAESQPPHQETAVQPPTDEQTFQYPQRPADMTDEDLRLRLKYVAAQFREASSRTVQRKLAEERKRIEVEINKRAAAKPVNSPIPSNSGELKTEFTDRADANAAMLAAAERTGQAYEVIEANGQFTIQPIKESDDNERVDTTGSRDGIRNDGAGSAIAAGRHAPDQSSGSGLSGNSDGVRGAGAASAYASTRNDVPAADKPANTQPALKERNQRFGSREKAESFIAKKNLADSHEVVQTGKVRFEVKPKAVEPAVNTSGIERDEPKKEPTDIAAGSKVIVSGSEYTYVKRNADGTHRVRSDGGEFDTAEGEGVTPAQQAPAKARQESEQTREAFINGRINEQLSAQEAKVRRAMDAVEALDIKAPAGISKVTALRARSRPSKDERALLLALDLAERDIETFRRNEANDRAIAGKVWDKLQEKRSADQAPTESPKSMEATNANATTETAPDVPAVNAAPADGVRMDADVGEDAAETEVKKDASREEKKPRKPAAKTRADERARQLADYFTPGNVLKGYAGHDRVLTYTPEENGSFTVKVQHVVRDGDAWVVAKGTEGRERIHATVPSERELRDGPVVRAEPETIPTVEKTVEKQKKAAAVAEESPPAKPASSKVEEAGEELTYNRRNRILSGLKWSDVEGMNDTLKAKETVKAKVWPKPDYEAMIADGMEPMIAHLVKQVYDSIAAKPQVRGTPTDADFQRYIDALNRVREGMLTWSSDKKAIADFVAQNARRAGAMLGKQVNLSTMVGEPAKSLLDYVYPGGWKNYRNEVVIAGGNKLLRALQPGTDELAKAMKEIKNGWPGKREAWQVQGYKVLPKSAYTVRENGIGGYQVHLDDRYFQSAKTKDEAEAIVAAAPEYTVVDKRNKIVGGAETEEKAIDTARDLTKREGKSGPIEEGMNVADAERVGVPRRTEGEDVTAQRLINDFGFRGINFGRWVPDNERQLHLNHAYDSFHDLAEVLGVPAPAISLNGMLGIAFGAQGGGKALAHFVPGVNEINITRTAGAGSLAHEWGHAVDHYFANQSGLSKTTDPFLTAHAKMPAKAGRSVMKEGKYTTEQYDRFAGLRPEILSAFKTIVDSMEKRDETPAESAARVQAQKSMSENRAERNLKVVRRDFDGTYPKQKAGDKHAGYMAQFDALAERITKGDLGDGKVKAGNAYLSPVVAEMRDLYKKMTGRAYDLDNSKTLQNSIDAQQYMQDTQREDRKHEPQKVSTDYAKNAAALDKNKGGKGYWRTPWEMFARAFDAYVSDQLDAKAAKNTYLSHAGRSGETVPTGAERDTINAAFETLINAIETREENGRPVMYSVADEGGEALPAIAQAAELFRLPASDKSTVEEIAADNYPGIAVKKLTNIPGETRYNFTLPDGQTARMMVRPFNKYGNSIYGFDLMDGDMLAHDGGRPGKNAEHADGRDDVWIDVSLLTPGSSFGSLIYNIASTYAHNTGKVFIGDPAGLSDDALQRRPEMMLSSALKFGTTDHLAPHPRQITGNKALGVPPLDWVYGDDAGNIAKLMDVTIANIENNGGNGEIVYNKEKGIFEDANGTAITRADIKDLARLGLGRAAKAGGATLARNAVFKSLLQGESGGPGVLGAFVQLLRNHDPVHVGSPLRDILYSIRPVRDPSSQNSVELKPVAEFGPVHTEYKDDPAAAIDRLMQDKTGEAIIARPDIGDVSLVYGDKNAGLEHIASRRGTDFMERLPELLKSGKTYAKDGQSGRIFIGNERDEATIRLDWDGQAKTWLLSAYEKYPDLNTADAVRESRRSQVVERRTEPQMSELQLKSALTKGVIGPVIASLIEHGTINLHSGTKTLPKGLGRHVRGIQAVTMPDGSIHVVASRVNGQNARAVLLHEMFHKGGERFLGSPEWSKLMGRGASLYSQFEKSSGKAREVFDRARDRVAAAKRQGAVSARMEVEEFLAYAIEEYEQSPDSLPAAIRKWVEDVIGMVKAWLAKRYGKQLGQVTPAQLAAIAKFALMDVAVDRRGELFGPIGELFSVSAPMKIEGKTLGQIANAIAQRFGAKKTGQGMESRGGNRSRYYTLPDGRELRVSDHEFPRGHGNGTAHVDVVINVDDQSVDVKQNQLDQLGIVRDEISYRSLNLRGQNIGGLEGFDYDVAAWEAAITDALSQAITGERSSADGAWRDVTQTAAFEKWFGKSKVVDANGKPLVVYHGTNADFSVFKHSRSDVGMHFGTAGQAADRLDYMREGGRRPDEGMQTMPVYLSIKNPLRLRDLGAWNADTMGYALIDLFPAESTRIKALKTAKQIRDFLISKGYDGIVYKNTGEVEGSAPYRKRIKAAREEMEKVFQKEKSSFSLDDQKVPEYIAYKYATTADEDFREANGEDSWIAFSPSQIKSAIGNNGNFDPANPDIRYSVAPEAADKVLTDAQAALDAPQAKDDFIGSVVGDMSLPAKLVLHPRQVAAVHPKFTPVYQTGVSQMETRDENVAELGKGMAAYDDLEQSGKENVNKVLELGRLTSQVYTDSELAKGVANTGERTVVVMDDKGKPQTAKVPVTALLTEAGEVVTLTPEESKAYRDLRTMFDQALDKMRDQTLEDMGFPELVGVPNAAKAIRDMIDPNDPAQAERMGNIAKFVAEIEQAKRAGYVPFARYGDYVVTVKEKVADPKFLDDGADMIIVKDLPDSFAPDMLELGAVALTREEAKQEGGPGWRISKDQKKAVEKLTEKTVYSSKVETGIKDLLSERKAINVEEIPAVKAAIAQARKEWVDGNPARRVVAFKSREKIAEQGVNLTDVSALAEISTIDDATWNKVHEKLLDAQKAKGFRRHLIHADNVPGYTGDFERAMADYVIGMSGYLSRRQHMKRWDNSIDAIQDQPRLRKYAEDYRAYMNNPQEELAMVRQIGFLSYIAGVMMSAFANLTQVPLLTVPTLSQVAPVPLVLKETAKAYKDALAMLTTKNGLDMFEPGKAPADVRATLQQAWNEGAFIPLETLDLMMTARQKDAGRRKGVRLFNDATKVISSAFTFAERLNRLVTYIAAARLADKPAIQKNAKRVLKNDALARREVLNNWSQQSFAEWVVDESQFRMGKANRPTVMRGVGSAIMQFKGFMMQTFEAWYRMAALHGKDGKYAMAASIAGMYALAGMWGLPGADDLRKLLEAIYKQITDKDLDMKTELRMWVARNGAVRFIGEQVEKATGIDADKVSNRIAAGVNKGVPYAALGIDMTRVGMGSVVPDSPLAAAGIPFDMLLGRPKRAFEKASAGDAFGAASELTPNFIKHPLVAAGWATDGVRDKQGNKILRPEDLSKWDLALKSLGSQPAIVTDVRDYEYAQRRQETAVDALKRGYVNKIAKTIAQIEKTSDPKERKALDDKLVVIYADISEHNAEATPEQIIVIDQRALRKKIVRELGGVQSTWGKERKKARGAANELRGVFGLQDEEGEE